MFKLTPRLPYLKPLSPAPQPAPSSDEPKPRLNWSDAREVTLPLVAERTDNQRSFLNQFPEYEFDADGTPYRMYSSAKVGPKPKLGKVEPNSTGQYPLRSRTGKRVTVSGRAIREMIAGEPQTFYVSTFALDDFPNDIFDQAGRAFSARNKRPRTCHEANRHGRDVLVYRLYHGPTDRWVDVTDCAIRRMRDGRSSYSTASVPDFCKLLGSEYPDFCADKTTGQPYRISSVRFNIAEPVRVQFNRSGRYTIRNYAGKRVELTPEQIMMIIHGASYEPPKRPQFDEYVPACYTFRAEERDALAEETRLQNPPVP